MSDPFAPDLDEELAEALTLAHDLVDEELADAARAAPQGPSNSAAAPAQHTADDSAADGGAPAGAKEDDAIRRNNCTLGEFAFIRSGVRGTINIDGQDKPFVAFGKAGKLIGSSEVDAKLNIKFVPDERTEGGIKIVAAFPADERTHSASTAQAGAAEEKKEQPTTRTDKTHILTLEAIPKGVKGTFETPEGPQKFVAFGTAGAILAKEIGKDLTGRTYNILHTPNPRTPDEVQVRAVYPAEVRRSRAPRANRTQGNTATAEDIPF